MSGLPFACCIHCGCPELWRIGHTNPCPNIACDTEVWGRLIKSLYVDDASGCWLWTGSTNNAGYGSITWGPRGGHRRMYVHRLAYERYKGAIPPGLVIDHLCRTPYCLNPDHLEAVTQRENILRGVGPAARCARVTHCPRGHEYNAQNTYENGRGRHCRTCSRDRQRIRRASRKDAVSA